jgi:ElaB/YqjD/DUF883 family membrane-anchored ribosome-binding protein
MNDQQLDHKVRQDAGKVKKEVTALVGDSATRFSKGFEKLTGDAMETVVGVATTVKKDVGHRLSQYNAKAQDLAEKGPDGFAKKAARYPWVAISIGLVIGVLLGILLKPAPQPVG